MKYKWLVIPENNRLYPNGYKIIKPELYEKIDQDIDDYKGFNYYFMGKPGTGKTELALMIFDAMKRRGEKGRMDREDGFSSSQLNANERPEWFVARHLWKDYRNILIGSYDDKTDALRDRERKLNRSVVFLDEIGDEQKEIKEENNNGHAFIGELLENYYDYVKKQWRANNQRIFTVATTNFDGKKTIDAYGLRILDRIYELFEVVEFNNKSFRSDMYRSTSINKGAE